MESSNLQVIQLPIDQLTFAEYNPRKISAEAFSKLTESLDQFGMVDPIIVNQRDGKNIICGGHQRVRAAKQLGMEAVPAVILKLSPAKEKALNVRLNNRSSMGEDDTDMLAELLYSLDEETLTMSGYDDLEEVAKLQDGFLAEEADKLLDEKGDKTKRYTLNDLEQLRQVYESKGGNPDTASFLAELRMVESGQTNQSS